MKKYIVSIEYEGETLLTVDDVARACNVSDKTIRRWAKEGHLAYTLVGPASRMRIARSELTRVMKGSNGTPPSGQDRTP